MSKYIDSEKLIAEIDKKWKELAGKNVKVGGGKYDIEIYTYLSIKNLINSLQQEQPEVDIWKEIHKYFNPHGMELQFDRSKGNTILKPEQLFNFARHFYELGQSTQYQKDRGEFAKLKAKEWQDGYNEGYAKGLNANKEK